MRLMYSPLRTPLGQKKKSVLIREVSLFQRCPLREVLMCVKIILTMGNVFPCVHVHALFTLCSVCAGLWVPCLCVGGEGGHYP